MADEYFAVSEKVEALYGQAPQLPADAEGPAMARLRKEHHRMLGNGYCTRPVELDCAFETICESCTYFATTIEFRPTLRRQHKGAVCARTRRRARSSSRASSTASQRPRSRAVEDPLDSDYLHNARSRASRPTVAPTHKNGPDAKYPFW